jgi:hypothetical protein
MELEVEEESDLWGPHVSEWRGKHTKHVCTNTVTVGPTVYKDVENGKNRVEEKCNDKFRNIQIVMVFLQLCKIVIA